MSFDKLLTNPFFYRSGGSYKATNTVFPVNYENENYIVKIGSSLSSLANAYYTLIDKTFYGSRRLSTSAQRFQREADILERLDGFRAPKLHAHDKDILVRQYLQGTDFRSLSLDFQMLCLDGLVDTVSEFHGRDVVIGDAHVKNSFRCDDGIYWLDFDGAFSSFGIIKDKALDILKLAYSTYTVTKNEDAALLMAETIAGKYSDKAVKSMVSHILKNEINPKSLWWSARLPRDGKLNEKIKKIFS